MIYAATEAAETDDVVRWIWDRRELVISKVFYAFGEVCGVLVGIFKDEGAAILEVLPRFWG